jgi:hypothetical protein
MKNLNLLKQYINTLTFRGKALFATISIAILCVIWELVS